MAYPYLAAVLVGVTDQPRMTEHPARAAMGPMLAGVAPVAAF